MALGSIGVRSMFSVSKLFPASFGSKLALLRGLRKIVQNEKVGAHSSSQVTTADSVKLCFNVL